jgi:hypothetical protein
MGEVKRIFNQAKIDRDTDARMVQPGFHRDALNVSVGESEGGDVGAVENLKGNEEISGQADVEGTTIGSVRDPNNDKVYWFNTSSTFDAIYEYDQSENTVTTILRDPKDRVASLPTCSPELQARITDPRSPINNRPPTPALPSDPVGGCTIVGQFNYDPNAEYNDGSCTPVVYGCTDVNASNYEANANTDDGSCSYGPSISVTISGDGSFYNSSSPVTLTANVANANGAFTYLWNTGATTQTISISGSNTTITGTPPGVTVTDSSGASATDNYSVTFSAAPSTPTYNFVGTTADSTGANITAAGGQSFYNRSSSQTIGFVSRATLSSNYEWVAAPTVGVSGLPSGVTASGISGGGGGTTGPAEVTISGTWSGTSHASPTITWNGGSAQVIPVYQHRLIITSGGSGLGSNISTSSASYDVTKNVGTSTTVTFNASCTPDPGYEWVVLPSVSSSSLPSGVTLGSSVGAPVGGTGARQVTASGTWYPTYAGTTNASVTWTGGSVQAVAPACNNYRVTYTGNGAQLNYTNCTTGNAGTYNLSNASGTHVITMQSQTFPTQGSGSGYTIYNITQI